MSDTPPTDYDDEIQEENVSPGDSSPENASQEETELSVISEKNEEKSGIDHLERSTLDELDSSEETDIESSDGSEKEGVSLASLVDGFVEVPTGQLLQQILEGMLLSSGKPLSIERIQSLFDEEARPKAEDILGALERIQDELIDRGFDLVEVASGFRFQVKQSVSPWVSRLWEEKPQRYSRALMETLALIAYRQPITRGDIEDIRGVAVSSSIIKTLLEREWVRIVGHKDVPGRPAMYATTKIFLDYFGLSGLDQLPTLSEIKDLDKEGEKAEQTVETERTLEEQLSQPTVLEVESEDEINKIAFEELEEAQAITDSVEKNLFAPAEEEDSEAEGGEGSAISSDAISSDAISSDATSSDAISSGNSSEDSSGDQSKAQGKDKGKKKGKNEKKNASSTKKSKLSGMASLLQKHGLEPEPDSSSDEAEQAESANTVDSGEVSKEVSKESNSEEPNFEESNFEKLHLEERPSGEQEPVGQGQDETQLDDDTQQDETLDDDGDEFDEGALLQEEVSVPNLDGKSDDDSTKEEASTPAPPTPGSGESKAVQSFDQAESLFDQVDENRDDAVASDSEGQPSSDAASPEDTPLDDTTLSETSDSEKDKDV